MKSRSIAAPLAKLFRLFGLQTPTPSVTFELISEIEEQKDPVIREEEDLCAKQATAIAYSGKSSLLNNEYEHVNPVACVSGCRYGEVPSGTVYDPTLT